MLSQLGNGVSEQQASDAILIVSELVTNSVLHAGVDFHESLFVELTTLGDHLRIAVTDPGSELEPRIHPAASEASGGFGLRLVEGMSSAWGVVRDASGTCVWCDLPLCLPATP